MIETSSKQKQALYQVRYRTEQYRTVMTKREVGETSEKVTSAI